MSAGFPPQKLRVAWRFTRTYTQKYQLATGKLVQPLWHTPVKDWSVLVPLGGTGLAAYCIIVSRAQCAATTRMPQKTQSTVVKASFGYAFVLLSGMLCFVMSLHLDCCPQCAVCSHHLSHSTWLLHSGWSIDCVNQNSQSIFTGEAVLGVTRAGFILFATSFSCAVHLQSCSSATAHQLEDFELVLQTITSKPRVVVCDDGNTQFQDFARKLTTALALGVKMQNFAWFVFDGGLPDAEEVEVLINLQQVSAVQT